MKYYYHVCGEGFLHLPSLQSLNVGAISREKLNQGSAAEPLCVCTINHQAPWHSSAPSAALLQRARTKITRVGKLPEPSPTQFYPTKYNSYEFSEVPFSSVNNKAT